MSTALTVLYKILTKKSRTLVVFLTDFCHTFEHSSCLCLFDSSRQAVSGMLPRAILQERVCVSPVCADSYERRLEAGGFEPPSRDASKQASTCLFALSFFASPRAKRQALGSAISEFVLSRRPEQPLRAACFHNTLTELTGKVRQDGPLIKQPWHTESRHLNVVAG